VYFVRGQNLIKEMTISLLVLSVCLSLHTHEHMHMHLYTSVTYKVR